MTSLRATVETRDMNYHLQMETLNVELLRLSFKPMTNSLVNNLLKKLQEGTIQENTRNKGMVSKEVPHKVVMSKHALSLSLATADEVNTTAALKLEGNQSIQLRGLKCFLLEKKMLPINFKV